MRPNIRYISVVHHQIRKLINVCRTKIFPRPELLGLCVRNKEVHCILFCAACDLLLYTFIKPKTAEHSDDTNPLAHVHFAP